MIYLSHEESWYSGAKVQSWWTKTVEDYLQGEDFDRWFKGKVGDLQNSFDQTSVVQPSSW